MDIYDIAANAWLPSPPSLPAARQVQKKSILFRNKPICTFFEGSLRGRKICFMLLIAYGYSKKKVDKICYSTFTNLLRNGERVTNKKVIPSTCTPFLFWAIVYIICAKTGQGDRAEAYPNQLSPTSGVRLFVVCFNVIPQSWFCLQSCSEAWRPIVKQAGRKP